MLLDNGASVSALTTADSITVNFTITFMNGGSHTLTISGIKDSTGAMMNPYGYTFTVTFV